MAVTIKICGITRADDAELLVRLGVDAIGLNFYEPSSRYLCPVAARDVARIAAGEAMRVGVFVDSPAAVVRQTIDEVGLDALQFQGDETPAYCDSFGLPYVRALGVQGNVDHEALEAAYCNALAILLDATVPGLRGGTGHRFDWKQWPERPGKNYMLAGGLTPENVRTAVERLQPWGVDVCSGVESPVKGIKCAEKMRRFVDEVRDAETG